MSEATPSPKNGLSYADAGVDIDAGNALVRRIKPFVKATARPGADSEIGGFGGLFDLKAAGFTDPILVAANDGVGTIVFKDDSQTEITRLVAARKRGPRSFLSRLSPKTSSLLPGLACMLPCPNSS